MDKATKWSEWLKRWKMTSLKINLKYLELNFEPKEADKNAAWELYIELLTRITTQPLPSEHGDEKAALESVHKLFELTRKTIKEYKKDCIEFTKIAVVVLNQIVRPFTAKWHKLSLNGAFSDIEQCKVFRKDLEEIQIELRQYTKMLADMAGVEDLTDLEDG